MAQSAFDRPEPKHTPNETNDAESDDEAPEAADADDDADEEEAGTAGPGSYSTSENWPPSRPSQTLRRAVSGSACSSSGESTSSSDSRSSGRWMLRCSSHACSADADD